MNDHGVAVGAFAGAVLAGGASRRMGRDKALVEVDGIAMARRVADTLRAAGADPVVVIGGDAGALELLGLDVVADQWPGDGPVGGIVTALEHTGVPTVVVACDLPWLDVATVSRLRSGLGTHRAALGDTGRPQPLCGIWTPAIVPDLRDALERRVLAVQQAIIGLDVASVVVDDDALRNVNTPGDLHR